MALIASTMSTQCGHCQRLESQTNLKLCGRCRNVSYCSLSCQRESWLADHRSLCRARTSVEDGIPLEVRDKPWTHEYLLVRNYLRDNCRVDPKELKQLQTDEQLVHDLHDKIFTHQAQLQLKEAQISLAEAHSSAASNIRSRYSTSYKVNAVNKDLLPPSAALALKDLGDAGHILQASSSSSLDYAPPHAGVLREAIGSVIEQSSNALRERLKISHENLLLKQQIENATKASASLPMDTDFAEKSKSLKSNQLIISKMEEKQPDYKKQIAELSKELIRSGFKEHFSHDKIVADAQAMTEKEELTKELSSQVAAFLGLPPDLSLAKVKLAEKKRTLSELGEMTEQWTVN